MLGTLRSGRGHPTPQEAQDALRQGLCMYSPTGSCSGPPASVGLRAEDDLHAVLVCRAHFGRLREFDSRSLSNLEAVLVAAFRGRRVRGR